MKKPMKILHIDSDYRVVYIVIFDGVQIRSSLPLETAISMLENQLFDLILTEPHNMAVLTPRTDNDKVELLMAPFYKDSINLSSQNRPD
jgi:hypothetical protein